MVGLRPWVFLLLDKRCLNFPKFYSNRGLAWKWMSYHQGSRKRETKTKRQVELYEAKYISFARYHFQLKVLTLMPVLQEPRKSKQNKQKKPPHISNDCQLLRWNAFSCCFCSIMELPLQKGSTGIMEASHTLE